MVARRTWLWVGSRGGVVVGLVSPHPHLAYVHAGGGEGARKSGGDCDPVDGGHGFGGAEGRQAGGGRRGQL